MIINVFGLFLQIPAGNSTRGVAGVTDIFSCTGTLITVNAADCLLLKNNDVTAAFLGGSATFTCKIDCGEDDTCYRFDLLSFKSDSSSVLSLRGGSQQPREEFRCCSAEGTGNSVNCAEQECTATSTTGSNASSGCCTFCDKNGSLSFLGFL